MIPIQCYADQKKIKKLRCTKYYTFQILHSKWDVQCYVHFKISLKIKCTMFCTFHL